MNIRGVARMFCVWAGFSALTTGCVYYNSIYNAERLLDSAEAYRAAGQDSLANDAYDRVVAKAAAGYRKEPEGVWADDALLLLGRAHLRLGDLRAARAALEEAVERADEERVRHAAQLYLGIALVEGADQRAAIRLLNRALGGLPEGGLRAEGHLWRGRVLLASGQADMGWWDLDRAGAEGPDVRVDAALERISWGLRTGERTRVREGFDRLLSYPEAARRRDTVDVLATRASERWGAADGADFLSGVDSSPWDRSVRHRIRLTRAALRRQAGDTAGARMEVEAIAQGAGEAAARARRVLAGWRLEGAEDVPTALAVVPILLPEEKDPAVARMLGDLQDLERFAEAGATDPLGLFAAGEVARDRLAGPKLARSLFLAYAEEAASEPWVPKALLAALDLTTDEGTRAWLRGRLEGRGDSPYVLAARGDPAPDLEVLEEELGRRLQEIKTR